MKTVLFLLLLCPAVSWAQGYKITPEDTDRKHSFLLMRDGSVVRGQIIRQDSTVISVRKRNGDLTFVEADQLVRVSANQPDAPVNATAPYTVFVLKDGTQLAGKFVRRDSAMITVRKNNGQLTYFEPELLVRVDSVAARQEPSDLSVSTGRAFANRFSPWLLTNQTAYNPEKGRLYYRNVFLFRNEFQYGITRNWSIGATVNPFFGTFEPNNQARETVLGATVNFNSKLTFPIGEQFRFGVNAIYQPSQKGYFYRLNEQIVLQGLMSFGSSQRNATLGYGMRIYPGIASVNKVTFISAGVMHKVSRNLTVLSDNTFYLNPNLSSTSAELSIALRFDRRRHAFDLGVLSIVQPYFLYNPYGYPVTNQTRAYFSPYIAYNLIIGRN